MTHDHLLRGCRPEPLGSYLQGLGVLRLVGQQVDPEATGHWTDAGFVLTTTLDEDALARFFLDQYVPTPMVSPWNNDSGIRHKASSGAWRRMESARRSEDRRLMPWREAIGVAHEIADRYPDDKSFKAAKAAIVEEARSRLPDAALEWVDTAVAVTASGLAYPHVLGTGGNLGRLDLSANVLTQVDSVIGLEQPAERSLSSAWLTAALFGAADVTYVKSPAGQYDPGRAGGLNASVFDEADALINPWSFLLQMEGTLVFASGIAKRLGAGAGADNVAAMPFTVRPAATGAGHLSSDEPAKGELWLPLWSVPSTLAEVRRLFTEARLRWGGRPARDGIDAARAVATLGTERGIPAFGRTAIVERLGQSPLAVSAGRVAVDERSTVGLTRQLDPWLERVRRASGSARSLADGVRAVEASLMTLSTTHGRGAHALHDLLGGVADLDRRVGQNAAVRGDLQPLPPLSARDWLVELDDGTAEFALAWGLASLREDRRDPREDAGSRTWCSSMRDYVRGTRLKRRARLAWADGPTLDLDLERDLVGSLAAVHSAHAARPVELDGGPDHRTTMRRGAWTDWRIVEAFSAGRLDDRHVARLVRMLVLLDVEDPAVRIRDAERRPPAAAAPAWRLLAPLFPAGRDGFVNLERDGIPVRVPLGAAPSWPAMLARERQHQVIGEALTRYRVRLGESNALPVAALSRGVDGRRLGAALLVGISPRAAASLVEGLLPPAAESSDD